LVITLLIQIDLFSLQGDSPNWTHATPYWTQELFLQRATFAPKGLTADKVAIRVSC